MNPDFAAGDHGNRISERNAAPGRVCGRGGLACGAGESGEMIGLPAGARNSIYWSVRPMRFGTIVLGSVMLWIVPQISFYDLPNTRIID